MCVVVSVLKMSRLPPHAASNPGKEKTKRRGRPIEITKEEYVRRQSSASRSAWSLASPRFDIGSSSSSGIRNTHQYRDNKDFKKGGAQDKDDDFDLSIDVDSDAELLLTPPKAQMLVDEICDMMDSDERPPPQISYRSLMSFDKQSFDEYSHQPPHNQAHNDSNNKVDCDQPRPQQYKYCHYKNDEESGNITDDDADKRTHSTRECEPSLERLERKMAILENDLRSERRSNGNKMLNESREQMELWNAIRLSAQLLGFNAEGQVDPDNFKQKLIRDSKNEVEHLKNVHQKELIKMREDYKHDVVDLQERLLKWVMSQRDLAQNQEYTIMRLKNELKSIRLEWKELKETSIKAFEKGTESVEINCSTLKNYVHEEFREAHQETERLKNELKNAHDKISSLENVLERTQFQPIGSVSSLDSHSAGQQNRGVDTQKHNPTERQETEDAYDKQVQGDGDGDGDGEDTWNDFTVKFREAIDGNLPQTSDASVVSKLEVYDTMKADKLFKKLCYSSKSPSASVRNKAESPVGGFFDCGQIQEDSDVFMDAESGET